MSKITWLGQSQTTLSHSICDKFGDLHNSIRMSQESSFTLGLPKATYRT